jgi:hypothetical protein
MNHYEIPKPRFALGIAAVAMTAITIGVSVVIPAQMDSNGGDTRSVMAAVAAPPSGLATDLGRAEVVALRDSDSSTAPCVSKVKARVHRHTLAAS